MFLKKKKREKEKSAHHTNIINNIIFHASNTLLDHMHFKYKKNEKLPFLFLN